MAISRGEITPQNFDEFFAPAKGKLDITGFPIQLTRAERTTGEINTRDGKIPTVLLGDAGATTNFFTGTGANRAIKSGTFLGGALRQADVGEASEWNRSIGTSFERLNQESISTMHRKAFQAGAASETKNFRIRPVSRPINPKYGMGNFTYQSSSVKPIKPKRTGATGFLRNLTRVLRLNEGTDLGLPGSIGEIAEKIAERKVIYDCIYSSIKSGYSIEVCDVKAR